MLFIIYLIDWFVIGSTGHVDQKPILQEITIPRKIVENQNIKLNCDLLNRAKSTFSWYFNDELIKENDRIQIIQREDMSSLMITEVSIEDLGIYRCLASNSFGSDQQKISVLFNSKFSKKILCSNY